MRHSGSEHASSEGWPWPRGVRESQITHVFVIALQLRHSLFPSHDICVVGKGFHARFGEKRLQGKAQELLYVSMTSNSVKIL